MRFTVHHHGTIASTSETAFEALASGTARHGDVHVARAQTQGRGRLGRAWHSSESAGLYMSAVLLPGNSLSAAGLTIAAGLAVLDAVHALGLENARLKWPNDVVVKTEQGDAKLAGILVETRGLDPLRPHYVVGIGVNVAQATFPAELQAERLVTSLALRGIDVTVLDLLSALLPRLAQRLEQITLDPGTLAQDFVAAMQVARQRIVVAAGERKYTGRIEFLELDTGLVLVADDGERVQMPLEIVRELRAL